MYVEVALTALELSTILYEHRGPLSRAFSKLINYWKLGHVKIAVFGLGGTGKTTLGDVLSGKMIPGTDTGKYELSYETDEVPVKGEYVSTLIIPGGQERFITTDWPKIYRMLAEGRSCGVINVVSWGHNAFPAVNYKESKYFEEISEKLEREPTKKEFINAYLETQRENELNILSELIPHISVAKKRVWMVTIVTKQDLWWKDRKKVRQYYEDGPYNKKIQELAKAIGANNFSHEYVSAALVMSNFKTNDGEVLIPTAEGYDQNLQYPNLINLLNVINSSIERSEN